MRFIYYLTIVLLWLPYLGTGYAEEKQSLTLDEVLEIALHNSPNIKHKQYQMQELEALVLQSGRKPNPEISIELENILGSGESSGVDEGELSINWSQLHETGKKRKIRTLIAESELKITRNEVEILKSEIIRELSKSFYETLLHQESLKWFDEIKQTLTEMESSAQRRVKAGAASSTEVTKAAIEINKVSLEELETRKQYIRALETLKLKMGDNSSITIIGQFEENKTYSNNNQSALIEHHYLMQRWSAEIEKQEAIIRLEKALGKPDFNWTGGMKYENGNQNSSLLAGASFPLMIHNKNKDNIKAATLKLKSIQELRENTRIELTGELRRVLQTLKLVTDQISLYHELIPKAKETLKMVQEGYQQGRFSYLDVLEGSRTLALANQNYTNTLFEYHTVLLDLQWIERGNR